MTSAQTFEIKNMTRKDEFRSARDSDPKGARWARKMRRQYAGAFGHSPVHVFNDLAFGTSAPERHAAAKSKASDRG